MKRLCTLAAFVIACLGSEVLAQQTSTGAFGQRTTGSSRGLTAPRNNTGSSSPGMSSIGAGTGGSLLESVGDVTGEAQEGARYTRNARAQSNEFVGAGAEDARAVGVVQASSNNVRGGTQQFSSLFSGRNGNVLGQLMSGQFNQGGNQRTRSAATQLRIPIRMDFNPTPIATTRFTAQFQQRLGRLPGLAIVEPIQVLVEGESVVLRGVVASEGDRQLAADLAKLEPGVSMVRNEITVQSVGGSDAAARPVPTTAIP